MKPSCIDLVSDLHKLIMRLKLIQWPLRSQRCLTPILSQLANIKNKLMGSQLLAQTLSNPQLRFVVSQTLTKFTKQAEDFLDYNSLANSRQESLLFVKKQVPQSTNNTRRSTTAIDPNKISHRGKVTDEEIRTAINGLLRDIETAINQSEDVAITFASLVSENGTYAFDITQDEAVRQWQSCQYKMKLAEEFVESRPDLQDQYKTLKNKYNSDIVVLALQDYQQWELSIIKLLNNLSLNIQRILSQDAPEENYFSKSTFAQQSNVVRKSLLTTMIQDQISDQKENSAYSLCSPVKIVQSEPLKQKKQHHNHKNKKSAVVRQLTSDITKPNIKSKEKKTGTKPQQNCAACSLF